MATSIWVANNTIVVPVNLRYNDDNGDPVTSLYPREYLILVGQDLNTALADIEDLQTCCSGNTNQIDYLTAAIGSIPPEYNTPEIPTQCLTPSGSTILPIDQVLNLLVTDWCSYIGVNGSQSDLAAAILTQCQNLNSAPSFGTPGTSMSAISGWKTSPTTIADTISNLWYTACDSRAGIQNALEAITPTCAQVIIDYQAIVDSSSLTFRLYFSGYSFIPTGYTDNNSIIKITDNSGNIYQTSFNIVDASVNSNPVEIFASGSTLSPTADYYRVQVTSKVENSTYSTYCEKVVIKDITNTSADSGSCCPDTGTFTAVTSGATTQFNLITGLSYTPSFVSVTASNSTTANILVDSNYAPYITRVSGGATITFLGAPSGTLSIDWAAFK